MTTIFKSAGMAASALLLVLPVLSAEDKLELNDGSVLSGKVLSIFGNDKVVLDSNLSEEPIHLRAQSLSSINFRKDTENPNKAPQLLHLVNGDVLPGTLQNLDSKEVSFLTGYANELTIPRNYVRSIDFGVTPQKLVYSGPKPITEWSDNDDWEWENGSLTCNTSEIGRAHV